MRSSMTIHIYKNANMFPHINPCSLVLQITLAIFLTVAWCTCYDTHNRVFCALQDELCLILFWYCRDSPRPKSVKTRQSLVSAYVHSKGVSHLSKIQDVAWHGSPWPRLLSKFVCCTLFLLISPRTVHIYLIYPVSGWTWGNGSNFSKAYFQYSSKAPN